MSGRLMRAGLVMGAVGLLGSAMLATPADARRYCFTDHFHYGSSSGERSKKVARAQAIASWAGFTEFEYGSAYSRFKIARSKRITCSQDASGWGCNVEAVPCRLGR